MWKASGRQDPRSLLIFIRATGCAVLAIAFGFAGLSEAFNPLIVCLLVSWIAGLYFAVSDVAPPSPRLESLWIILKLGTGASAVLGFIALLLALVDESLPVRAISLLFSVTLVIQLVTVSVAIMSRYTLGHAHR